MEAAELQLRTAKLQQTDQQALEAAREAANIAAVRAQDTATRKSMPIKNEQLADVSIFTGANTTVPAANDARVDSAELQQFCQANGIEQSTALREFLKTHVEKCLRSEP